MSPYEILQVPPDATESEIKAAYRRLAKAFHPDSGSPGDIARFRAVQEAYEALTDPDRARRRVAPSPSPSPVSWTGGFQEPVAPFRRGFQEVGSPWPEPGTHLDIVLSQAEAGRGGRARIEIPLDVSCSRCGGAGFDFFGGCPSCAGAGRRRLYERLEFVLPRGIEEGEVVSAQSRNGVVIRARVRVR